MIESFTTGSGILIEFQPMKYFDMFQSQLLCTPDEKFPYAPIVIDKNGSSYHHCSCQTIEDARNICHEYSYEDESIFVLIYQMGKIIEGYYLSKTTTETN
jgi:hypothetical protein